MALYVTDIMASTFKHLADHFAQARICWPGREWDITDVDCWVEPHFHDVIEDDSRRSQSVVRGRFTVNTFRKVGMYDSSTNNSYTAVWLADLLNAAFSHTSFAVYDYVSGDGYTRTGTVEMEPGTVAPLGVFEANDQASFAVRWMAS